MEIDTVKDLRELLEKLPDDAMLNFKLGCNDIKDPQDEEFCLSYLYQLIASLHYGFGHIKLFWGTLELRLDEETDDDNLTFQFVAPNLENDKAINEIVKVFFTKHKDLIDTYHRKWKNN